MEVEEARSTSAAVRDRPDRLFRMIRPILSILPVRLVGQRAWRLVIAG